MTIATADHSPEHAPTPKRRDFLYLAATAMGVVGVGAALWPFTDSLEPSGDTLAAGGPVDVDLGALRPGQQITVRWRSRPIFVLYRTPADLEELQQPDLVARLADPNSETDQQGKYAANWHRSIKPDYLLVVGICTHLGCTPKYRPKKDSSDLGADWPGGYHCPCHGSKYDLSGRVFKNVPAPYNLPVPPYRFVKDRTVRIGENPPNAIFEFESITQI